ncbi:MAG: hypothetical protein JSS89_13320 [Bacteroidetes bacterium]|nr:hypothetical protein [Bacteroidota bacterium]
MSTKNLRYIAPSGTPLKVVATDESSGAADEGKIPMLDADGKIPVGMVPTATGGGPTTKAVLTDTATVDSWISEAIPALSIPAVANKKYRVTGKILLLRGASADGVYWGIGLPAGATLKGSETMGKGSTFTTQAITQATGDRYDAAATQVEVEVNILVTTSSTAGNIDFKVGGDSAAGTVVSGSGWTATLLN